MLSSNMKKTLESINEKSFEVAQKIKHSRHIFFCGQGIADCIAKEGALKMKELTYLHCQSINLSDLGNNFYCYLKKHSDTPTIFIILDKQPNKAQMISEIEKLAEEVKLMPIIVTDIKEKTQREHLSKICEDRIFYVQKSGPYLSALLCVLPL